MKQYFPIIKEQDWKMKYLDLLFNHYLLLNLLIHKLLNCNLLLLFTIK